MDTKDNKLVQLLQRDARAPILTLARAIGLSRSATQARVARLLKDGCIKRFTVELGSGTGPTVVAHLLAKLDAGKTCVLTVPHIRKIAAASDIHSVAGPYDLVIRLEAQSVAEIENSRAKIATINGIQDVLTLMVLENHLR